MNGNEGNDLLDGGADSDILIGGAGEDTFKGGAGNYNDVIYGGELVGTTHTDTESDTIDYSSATAAVTVPVNKPCNNLRNIN